MVERDRLETQAFFGLHQPVAEQVYFDFDPVAKSPGEDASALDFLPTGLWGLEGRGKYAVDAFILFRFIDGVVAVGYTNPRGLVNEIRIDCDWDRRSDITWTRDDAGRWTSVRSPDGKALFAGAGLTEGNAGVLEKYMTQATVITVPSCGEGE